MTATGDGWEFWVDRGGTFTDLVARRPDGKLLTHKLLSENPEHYDDAAVQGIRELLGLRRDERPAAGVVAAVKMGTTIATNALLERKGERTLLLMTAGLTDLPFIGYQTRPRLFDLSIRRPSLLFERVAGVPERLAADGRVVVPLAIETAREALESAYADGIRTVAVVFMHGYQNPQHERRVGELAATIGFTQISLSHEASPLVKIIPRADTAVVDAYLTPVLHRYVNGVRAALARSGGGRLMFMRSNGGLTDADYLQGKDAILSGPAAGVVGMARTAARAGFTKVIGFDMGGTSTDVCHYAGDYERVFESEVAGVRMRVPMMHIHTVAAGGGSILRYEDGRYQVGPESAGANPGPACYRRGGPLTVTDCNVMLGRLHAAHFPAVFGADAKMPLDEICVRQQFSRLAADIAESTGQPPLSPEDTAAGFLRIAVENMANAIKKISVQRGYDITQYTLNCFGGAGGQHACMIADTLALPRVLIHHFAGVLSAYGMGLADIRVLRERQFEQPLTALADAEAEMTALAESARSAVGAQGVAESAITVVRRARLRYVGAHQPLTVAFGTAAEMTARFQEAHRAYFGFGGEQRQLFFEVLEAEAIGDSSPPAEPPAPPPTAAAPQPAALVQMQCAGGRREAPLYHRRELPRGARLDGPAIISEDTGTTIVEEDWRASVGDDGHLLMTRVRPRPPELVHGRRVDPVMLEIFNNLFMSIAEQMGGTLANTAYSVNIKERLDFSCALFDADGSLVANAPHMPVHLGSMSESVRVIIQRNQGTMRPGDSFVLNSPFDGGTHLPDMTVITPVFDEDGAILFFVGSRGHHADVGGRTPGSAPPDSRHIEEEGVVIENFKIVQGGELQDAAMRALLSSGPYPCRNVGQNMADLEAQIAANETGVREVRKMLAHFGLPVVRAYMHFVQQNAEESVRRVIGSLRDGSFIYPLDNGGQIAVRLQIDKERREASIDFSGTSPQDDGNRNAPSAVCRAAVLYVFRTLTGADVPLNEGCLKPLHINIPAGCMLNPRYPAAVIAGNTEVSQAVTDCLFGAVRAIAGSQGTMNNFVWGDETIQNYETICGGTGAGADFDGADAVHSHMTNTRMTDPEILERRFPVRVEEMSVRRGSGGRGRRRGGDGVVRRLRFLQPMTVTLLASNRRRRPFGLDGGEDGVGGEDSVHKADGRVVPLQGNDEYQVEANDTVVMKTPGGGGYGKPPDKV